MRDWTHDAIRKIEADFQRSADTHLIKVELPAINTIFLDRKGWIDIDMLFRQR